MFAHGSRIAKNTNLSGTFRRESRHVGAPRAHIASRGRFASLAAAEDTSHEPVAGPSKISDESSNHGEKTAAEAPKASDARSGRAFLNFAYKLRGIDPDVGTAKTVEVLQDDPSNTLAKIAQKESDLAKKEAELVRREAELLKREVALVHTEASISVRSTAGLPPLPAPPSYPCPHLTEDEIKTYLLPLYSRGWFVGSSEYLRDSDEKRSPDASPQLVKQFHFAEGKHEWALEFASDIAKLQSAENHHCVLEISDGFVYVRTHTHTALPPPKPDANADAKPEKQPGITLRDVRLAMLVEQAFRPYLKQHAADYRSQHARQQWVRPETPQGIEERRLLQVQMKNRRPCIVCGKKSHRAPDCPQQYTLLPMTPCQNCGAMHWSFQCNQK